MRSFSWRACAFVWTVVGAASLATWLALSAATSRPMDWPAFAVLAGAAVVSQLFPVVTAQGVRYELSPVFIFAAVLLLPVGASLGVTLVAVLAEWVVRRRHWRISLFNAGNIALGIVVAQTVYRAVAGGTDRLAAGPGVLIAVILAVAAFTLLNHLVIALMLLLLRASSERAHPVFHLDLAMTDATLFFTGTALAALWQVRPWLVGFILLPLFLIYRGLLAPLLREQADSDPKTGLHNARYLGDALAAELQRAARFARPLAVVMADLDLLRDVNNRYGHLAGDAVIRAVADLIRGTVREFDVAARFGGEEFVLVLPECDAEGGLAVAERLRRSVDSAEIAVPTSLEPLRATLSLGVASYPAHGRTAEELLNHADRAVYRAKSLGRNRTCVASPDPSGSLAGNPSR